MLGLLNIQPHSSRPLRVYTCIALIPPKSWTLQHPFDWVAYSVLQGGHTSAPHHFFPDPCSTDPRSFKACSDGCITNTYTGLSGGCGILPTGQCDGEKPDKEIEIVWEKAIY